TQRQDGGWAQLPDMESDAYATGSALVALHQAGGLAVDDRAYRRGLSYLISTQRDDGSWHVVSRSKPFQTYFESGYPHGKDQFISIAAGGWATTALALALPKTTPGGADIGGGAADHTPPKPQRGRLLTAGNSYSQDATRFLGDLAKAAGHVLIHHQASIGGATLARHWEKAQRHEDDPEDPVGLHATKRSLKQELRAEPWDFITVQQASIHSHDLSTYRPYARDLFDYAKRCAPQPEVLVHQTWAYRCDDPRFAEDSSPPGEPVDQEAMYRGLTAAYRTIAGELGTRLIPVGDAFHRADTDPTWGYRPDTKFDFKDARRPALPDQAHSLHVGWQWTRPASGTPPLRMDGHHANGAGQYLGACVFYEVLLGESVVGHAFVPQG